MWDGFWFLANRRAWDKLPAEVRTVVARHINAAGMKERADVAELNAGLQKELAAKGMQVDVSAENLKKELKTVGERMTADWIKTAGDDGKAVIDAYNGKK